MISTNNYCSKVAFTLVEIVITVLIISMVAIITISSLNKKISNRQNVVKLIQVYNALSNAFDVYMIENNCVGNIALCTNQKHKQYGIHRTDVSFKDIADHLNIVDHVCGNDTKGKKWLNTQPFKMLDGTMQKEPWEAPSLYGKDAWPAVNCYYLFKNNAVMHVTYVDTQGKSGFGSIDVNGKKGPNAYGVDVFPFGIGAYNNPNHWASKSINPFWAEDGAYNSRQKTYKGMCRISCPICNCGPDKSSPTAYVLKYRELPVYK